MNGNTQPLRKKARISAVSLAKAETQSRLRAGKLLKLACANQPVISGEVRQVCMEGVVIDFRKGREPSKLPHYSFVTFADGTGTCSLGEYTATAGLENFRVPDEEISDGSRCFFEVRISGNISWYPNRKDPLKPVLIVKGTFEKLQNYPSMLSKFLKLFFPTCDVLDQISKEEFAQSSKYTTPAVLAEVSSARMMPNSTIVDIGIEDLVGVAMIKVSDVSNSSSFIENNSLVEGKFILMEGPLAICEVTINGETYPCLLACEANIKITEICSDEMSSYKHFLCEKPGAMLQGVIPSEENDFEN